MAVAVAPPTSISVRSHMWVSNLVLTLMLGMPYGGGSYRPSPVSRFPAPDFNPPAEIGSAKRCAAAARAIREWGWGDPAESGSSSVTSIVAAVNYELRLNSGRLPSQDVERLRTAAWSTDPCVREVSAAILEIQSEEKVARGRSTRLVKSVTPQSEKQSSSGEDSTS